MLRALIAFLVAGMCLNSCVASNAPPGATVSMARDATGGSAGITRSSDLDVRRPIRQTWEAASIAEARRTAPWLAAPAARRVRFGADITLVRVEAAGYCHLFGGLYDSRKGWQANDTGEC